MAGRTAPMAPEAANVLRRTLPVGSAASAAALDDIGRDIQIAEPTAPRQVPVPAPALVVLAPAFVARARSFRPARC